jgi:hypothetical protein
MVAFAYEIFLQSLCYIVSNLLEEGGWGRCGVEQSCFITVSASGILYDDIMKNQYKNKFSGPKLGERESNKPIS